MNVLRIIVAAGLIAASASSFGASADESALIKRSRKLSELVTLFWSKNDGRLPKDLDELLNFTGADKSAIASLQGSDKPGFKLLNPADKVAHIVNPSSTKIIQSLDITSTGKRAVVFVDGHVELHSAD